MCLQTMSKNFPLIFFFNVYCLQTNPWRLTGHLQDIITMPVYTWSSPRKLLAHVLGIDIYLQRVCENRRLILGKVVSQKCIPKRWDANSKTDLVLRQNLGFYPLSWRYSIYNIYLRTCPSYELEWAGVLVHIRNPSTRAAKVGQSQCQEQLCYYIVRSIKNVI